MATKQQAVKVEGQQNQVITVGNDLVMIEKSYVDQKPDFFIPNLEQYQPPKFVSPENASDLAVALYQQRLLILGGSPEIDKDDLARHIAWYLSSRVEQDPKPELQKLEVREWFRTTDYHGIILGLQEAKEPTIFILPQISPNDLAYDPHRLQIEARKWNHYVIASTPNPLVGWKISTDEAPPLYWRELSVEALYSPEKLTDVLIQQLLEVLESLPPELSKLDPGPTTLLAGRITIQQAAARLKTPKNIAYFVEILCQQKRPLTEANLEEWLNTSRDDSRALAQWFLSSQTNEKLVALGLSLFQGLYDDQFFTSLEQVFDQSWRRRDPHLVYSDYHDLENLGNFYEFIETQEGGFKIDSKNPGQRKMLFDLLWKSHRRQLLTSLPVLSRLVINSVQSRDTNLSLYGSHNRRRELREALGEALSDLGLVSPGAVEEILIQLAADRDFAIQAVAARAMARWREYQQDRALFDMLTRWQKEARFSSMVKAWLEGKDEKTRQNPEEYIRATVAVIAAEAAQYDPPNQLSQELVDLFKQLADDQNELVRDRFTRYTLPKIVMLHLGQVRKELHEMVRYVDLILAIGASLARAYRFNPEEVVNLLNAWYLECERNRPKQVDHNVITHRDALLATVVTTYGQINYDEGSGLLKADEVFKRLLKMLETERHRFIRTAIVIAITFQAREHFEMVEEQLRWLVPEVTPNEREEIVKILKEVYIKQRSELEGGDDAMDLKDVTYSVWSEPAKRPLTKVEQAMYRWLEIDGNVAARQIATQACVEFTLAVDQPEREYVKKKKEEAERKKQPQQPTGLAQPFIRSIRQISLMQRVATWLATLSVPDIRPMINDILPEASVQFRSHRAEMEYVIYKWKISPVKILQRAAKHLRSAITHVENAPIYIIGLVVLLLISFCCICPFTLSLLNSFFNR